MKKTINEQLTEMTEKFGPEIMLKVCEALKGKLAIEAPKAMPSITIEPSASLASLFGVPDVPHQWQQILSPAEVMGVFDGMDIEVNNLEVAAEEVDSLYTDRAHLARQASQLETAVQLDEATAIMNANNDGTFAALKNDTLRDAFRRQASAENRKKLAEVQGDLASIESKLAGAKETQRAVEARLNAQRSKAALMAALFNFLGGRV